MKRTTCLATLLLAGLLVLLIRANAEPSGQSKPAEDAYIDVAGKPRVEALMELQKESVEYMQVFRLEYDAAKERYKKHVAGVKLEGDLARSLLELIQKSEPAKLTAKEAARPLSPTYVLSVKLRNGETIDVPYDGMLDSPFGSRKSLDLKTALRACAAASRCSIIQFKDGQVENVTHSDIPIIGTGTRSSKGLTVGLAIDAQGKLELRLKIEKDGKLMANDSFPILYGEAKVVDHDQTTGYRIVMLHPV